MPVESFQEGEQSTDQLFVVGQGKRMAMEPFDTLGLPSPDECLGVLGLIVSIVGAIVGIVWLIRFDGQILSFVLIVLSAVLGWVSFMYCEVWEQSLPIPR